MVMVQVLHLCSEVPLLSTHSLNLQSWTLASGRVGEAKRFAFPLSRWPLKSLQRLLGRSSKIPCSLHTHFAIGQVPHSGVALPSDLV